MKKIVVISSAALLISSCITRDNPLDAENPDFKKPSFTTAGIPSDLVVLSDPLKISCTGVNDKQQYRFKIDNENWTGWQNGSFSKNLSDAHHGLTIQSIYPGGQDTVEEHISFSKISGDNSFYFSPAVKSSISPFVTLSVLNLQGSAATVHCTVHGASIAAAVPAGDTNFVKILYKDSVADLTVLPGGKEITGSREIMKLTLKDVTASPVTFDLTVETKTGSAITVNSRVGTLIK